VTPKLRSAFSLPAIDWNMSPSAAPFSSAFICVVTCARQQFCVGTRHFFMKSSVALRIAAVCSGWSVTGLTPMTASPVPNESPSRIDARMPSIESDGWFGCSRTERRPGSPTVFVACTTTRILRAATMRSRFVMSFAQAAIISLVSPRPRRRSSAPSLRSSRTYSRSCDTVQDRTDS